MPTTNLFSWLRGSVQNVAELHSGIARTGTPGDAGACTSDPRIRPESPRANTARRSMVMLADSGKALPLRPQVQACVRALELGHHKAGQYMALGRSLLPGEVVLVRGESLTQRQCYMKALEQAPDNSVVCLCLGHTLAGDETITLADGVTTVSERDCYRMALERDANNANAYLSLGAILADDASVTVMLNGQRQTLARADCRRYARHILETGSIPSCPPSSGAGEHSPPAAWLPNIEPALPGSGVETVLAAACRLQARLGLRSRPAPAPPVPAVRHLVTKAMRRGPLVRAVEAWCAGNSKLEAERVSGWHRIAAEEGQLDFARFLDRLKETADYQSPAHRPVLEARVAGLLETLRSAGPALRQTCFALAQDGLSHCGDRVALTLDGIDLAIIDYRAEQGDLSQHDLFVMRRGLFRLQVLDEAARTIIPALAQRLGCDPSRIDAVEVALAYRTRLGEALCLPAVGQSMLYEYAGHLDDADLQAAYDLIVEREESHAYVEFMAAWAPWQRQLERSRRDVFGPLEAVFARRQDALSVPPPRASDGDYTRMLAQHNDLRQHMFASEYTLLTLEWMEEHA